MSPIVARAAIRAATQGQARQFSVMRTMRNVARSFEAHPFSRLPISSNSQAGDWGRQIKRVSGQAAIFFPGLGLILGWPIVAKMGLDGYIGAL